MIEFDKNISFIFTKIANAGFEARIVGGFVRDFIKYKTYSDDIDFATTATPKQVIQIFKDSDFKITTIGINFGSVTLLKDNYKYEITTLRNDINTDGRHADVIFGQNFEDDSKRRDFTINALYLDCKGQVYDFHNGLEDLQSNIVRFIGNPETRIQEDFLRIMRFFRFSAKFGNFDDKELFAVKKYSKEITTISKERFTAELAKICKEKFGHKALKIMNKCNIFESWFGYKIPIFLDFDLHNLQKDQIIFCLFQDTTIIKKIDLTKQEIRFIETCCRYKLQQITTVTDEFLLFCLKYITDLSMLAKMLNITTLTKQDKSYIFENLKELPINGFDLIELGIKNEQVGQYLNILAAYWVKNKMQISKDNILHYAKKLITKNEPSGQKPENY